MALFDKYFNGGEEIPLPVTRRKAFFFYAKEHFGLLVLISVCGALFFLPELVWLYGMHYAKVTAISALDLSAAEYASQLSSVLVTNALVTGLGSVPLISLFAVGLAGVFYCVKRMAFAKSCRIKHFFCGIKENALRFLFAGAVVGVSFLFLEYNLTYANALASRWLSAAVTGLAILQFLLASMFACWFAVLSVVYVCPFGQTGKNALKLTFAKFLQNLLVFAAVTCPWFATLLIPAPFQILAMLVLSFLYIGFAALGIMCYCCYIFDLLINPALGEEFVGVGLRKPEARLQTNEEVLKR